MMVDDLVNHDLHIMYLFDIISYQIKALITIFSNVHITFYKKVRKLNDSNG